MLICIIVIFIIIDDLWNPTLRMRSYNAVPHLKIEELLEQPFFFRQWTKFDPAIWLQYVAQPLLPHIRLPRKKDLEPFITNIPYLGRMRKCQISDLTRILRWNIMLTGVTIPTMMYLTDQSESTVVDDYYHVQRLFFAVFSDLYLSAPNPNTPEYQQLRQLNNFYAFTNAVYAIDVTRVKYLLLFDMFVCVCGTLYNVTTKLRKIDETLQI